MTVLFRHPRSDPRLCLLGAATLALAGCAASPIPGRPRPQGPGSETDSATAPTGTLRARPFPRCADPDARSRLGPFEALDGGPDWQAQRGAENLHSTWTGMGMAVEDFDGDGSLDVFLPQAGEDDLLLGLGDGRFVAAPAGSLPADAGPASGASAVDVEGDGDADLFLTQVNASAALLLNDGTGRFVASTADWLGGIRRAAMGSGWADGDGDGDLDLVVLSYGSWDPGWLVEVDTDPLDPVPQDILWWNEGDGAFSAGELPDVAGLGFAFAGGWQDLDLDGRPDLYLANDKRRDIPWAPANLLLWNAGGRGFEDHSRGSGATLETLSMGFASADLNEDGVPDLAVSCGGEEGGVHLFESAGEGWAEATRAHDVQVDHETQFTAWGVDLGDIDNDGDLDMPLGFGLLLPDVPLSEPLDLDALDEGEHTELGPVAQPDAFFEQDEEGRMVDRAGEWGLADEGITRGLLLVDLDQDGWLDLIKRDVREPARLYRGRCGTGHALTIDLHAPAPNTRAIGAMVTVVAEGQSRRRWVRAGGQSLSSSKPPRLHLGLGELAEVERIEVAWPDGSRSVFEEIETDQHLDLYHPDAPAP